MARILVTGAAGFIGAEVVQALAGRGDEVTAFDLVLSPKLAALEAAHSGVSVVLGELTEWPALCDLMRPQAPDGVIHCAAVVGVLASVQAPAKTFKVNVEGSLNLFEAMRLYGVKRLVHMSTEETYGHFQAPLIDENHPQNPIMAYGISKLAVEHLGRSYGVLYGLEVINTRVCWAYGPTLPRARVPKTIIDAALAGQPLHLPWGGDMAVDHSHIDDVVAGILAALDLAEHPFDAYNIASGEATSVAQIVEIVKQLVPGAELSAAAGEYQHGDTGTSAFAVAKGALDISRAREVLGYAPKFDIRRGLAAYVDALKNA
ncbi:MAG TPA: NAD(P)-dependent oxidoreductase [Alphaproteobacteria bacterium]|jgi:nucleoside-diphosphate-sugar epimerase|nr:NAD(P)-dependent oxidoreductase [Alphaproteobacteria bacterium]MDP6270611.1 NAD(P)-dependent oxidoreductase [Alphaproteobacteria bacterium]HJM51376.1 NAD(P)-dependent oxidoreductase [Alphaproteobacteria bacterium]